MPDENIRQIKIAEKVTFGRAHTVTILDGGEYVVWDEDRGRYFTAFIDGDATGYFDAGESNDLEHSKI